MGPGTIVRQAGGYRLSADAVAVDADRFTALLVAAVSSIEHGDPAGARDATASALAMVRGPVFGDLADDEGLRPEAIRLEEEIVRVRECSLRAAVDLGDPSAEAELQRFVAAHPPDRVTPRPAAPGNSPGRPS